MLAIVENELINKSAKLIEIADLDNKISGIMHECKELISKDANLPYCLIIPPTNNNKVFLSCEGESLTRRIR